MSLEDLLRRLVTGKTHTLGELAAGLHTSPELLQQMLRDLERAGYIRPIGASCGKPCQGCPYQGLCRLTHGGRIWAVTQKGFRAAAIT